MGRPKGGLPHPSGRTCLEEALHRLAPWARVRVVAGRGGGESVAPGIPWLRDPPGARGPLAGIAAAGIAFPAAYYLVLAVDLPAARPELLMACGRRHPGRAVVGEQPDGSWQPLAGLYPGSQVRRAPAFLLRRSRRVMDWARVGAESPLRVRGPWWANINRPEEARRHLGPQGGGEAP